VLINITGGKDLTLHEVSKSSQLIHRMAHPEANIIFGTVIDNSMKEMVKVTVIATGFETMKQKEATVDEVLPQPFKQTPPPFQVERDTPPYLFEPKGGKAPLWEPPAWEKQYEPYETPTFIRRSKHSGLRKHPDDLG
jgi:cell division protein FtsZ